MRDSCIPRDGSFSDGLVGLAAYVASEGEWAGLEREFNGLLSHLGMTHSDMNDLVERRTAFKGKDRVQAHNAAADIVAYLAGLNEWSFRRYSCVVRTGDYQRAAAVLPRLQAKPIHAICVDHCVGRLFRPRFREERDPERNIEIYFDVNEPVVDHIRNVWKVERDDPTSWARYVYSITELHDTDRLNRPIQAVDALAWVSRRYRAYGDHQDWHTALCGGKRSQFNAHDFYDYDALVAKYSRPNQFASSLPERDADLE